MAPDSARDKLRDAQNSIEVPIVAQSSVSKDAKIPLKSRKTQKDNLLIKLDEIAEEPGADYTHRDKEKGDKKELEYDIEATPMTEAPVEKKEKKKKDKKEKRDKKERKEKKDKKVKKEKEKKD